MPKISSNLFFHRKLFPILWYGFFLFLAFDGFKQYNYGNILLACVCCVISYFLDKHLLHNLAEDVIDYGEYLLVKLKNVEDKIYISNIKSISFNHGTSPQKITLFLIKSSVFGNEIIFSPTRPSFDFYNYKKNKIVENLEVRIHGVKAKNGYSSLRGME